MFGAENAGDILDGGGGFFFGSEIDGLLEEFTGFFGSSGQEKQIAFGREVAVVQGVDIGDRFFVWLGIDGDGIEHGALEIGEGLAAGGLGAGGLPGCLGFELGLRPAGWVAAPAICSNLN